MSEIQSLYVVGIALCLFSTGILGATTARPGRPLSYFAVYLGLESLCFLFELLTAHPATPLKALWQGLLMATSLLIAPCLWLAIKESVEGRRPTLACVGWRHLAVIIAGVVLTLPLIETAHFGVTFDNPDRVVAPLLEPAIHETMLLCLAIFAVQVPYYLWQCRRLLLEQRVFAGLGSTGASIPSHSWLHISLIIVCTTWLLGVLRTLAGALSAHSPGFFALVALIDVSVTIGCVYLIVKRVTCTAPREMRAEVPSLRATDTESASSESKYAKSQLDASVRTRIVRKLEVAFRTEEIYRDSRLSLGSLSRRINENEHYVSQVMNQELDTTFYELVNRHRIEHAKRLLVEASDQNVLDVALTVGFNAKSTFNSAFRRHTGMTPREYRSGCLPGEAMHSTPSLYS